METIPLSTFDDFVARVLDGQRHLTPWGEEIQYGDGLLFPEPKSRPTDITTMGPPTFVAFVLIGRRGGEETWWAIFIRAVPSSNVVMSVIVPLNLLASKEPREGAYLAAVLREFATGLGTPEEVKNAIRAYVLRDDPK